MTESTATACPSWCVSQVDRGDHAHVSDDVMGGSPDQPLVARLVRMGAGGADRVLLNDRVATVEDVRHFVSRVRHLLDGATLAEPGLGFVPVLLRAAGVDLGKVAEAAGVDPGRVRRQSRGERELSVSEFDRVALAAARLVGSASSPASS
jgi:hypothetical protein